MCVYIYIYIYINSLGVKSVQCIWFCNGRFTVSKNECKGQQCTESSKECTSKILLLSLIVLILDCKSCFYHLVAV